MKIYYFFFAQASPSENPGSLTCDDIACSTYVERRTLHYIDVTLTSVEETSVCCLFVRFFLSNIYAKVALVFAVLELSHMFSTGSECMLTPEHSMEIQNAIGADIMMQLDDVVHSSTTGPRVEEAMHR